MSTGCSMKLTLGNGKGKEAFVTVTKTGADYLKKELVTLIN